MTRKYCKIVLGSMPGMDLCLYLNRALESKV